MIGAAGKENYSLSNIGQRSNPTTTNTEKVQENEDFTNFKI